MAGPGRLGEQGNLYVQPVMRELKYRLSVETVINLHLLNSDIESFQSVGNCIPICRVFSIVLSYNFGIWSPRVATENIGMHAGNSAYDLL